MTEKNVARTTALSIQVMETLTSTLRNIDVSQRHQLRQALGDVFHNGIFELCGIRDDAVNCVFFEEYLPSHRNIAEAFGKAYFRLVGMIMIKSAHAYQTRELCGYWNFILPNACPALGVTDYQRQEFHKALCRLLPQGSSFMPLFTAIASDLQCAYNSSGVPLIMGNQLMAQAFVDRLKAIVTQCDIDIADAQREASAPRQLQSTFAYALNVFDKIGASAMPAITASADFFTPNLLMPSTALGAPAAANTFAQTLSAAVVAPSSSAVPVTPQATATPQLAPRDNAKRQPEATTAVPEAKRPATKKTLKPGEDHLKKLFTAMAVFSDKQAAQANDSINDADPEDITRFYEEMESQAADVFKKKKSQLEVTEDWIQLRATCWETIEVAGETEQQRSVRLEHEKRAQQICCKILASYAYQ